MRPSRVERLRTLRSHDRAGRCERSWQPAENAGGCRDLWRRSSARYLSCTGRRDPTGQCLKGRNQRLRAVDDPERSGPRGPTRPVRGGRRPVRQRQVHAALARRRARCAVGGHLHRRPEHHAHEGGRPRRPARRESRLHLPGVPPHSIAHGLREHPRANGNHGVPRGTIAGAGARRGSRLARPRASLSVAALGRRTAAGGNRARVLERSPAAARRRADRKSRYAERRARARAPREAESRAGHDAPARDARAHTGVGGRAQDFTQRRPHRQRRAHALHPEHGLARDARVVVSASPVLPLHRDWCGVDGEPPLVHAEPQSLDPARVPLARRG
jgi:hypothetical protein